MWSLGKPFSVINLKESASDTGNTDSSTYLAAFGYLARLDANKLVTFADGEFDLEEKPGLVGDIKSRIPLSTDY